ncbi:MAG: ABC transporter ATP-binding protein [Lachnospiraceae bacterium]|nr:ABC transporter ATP-binding protein [Lachnospiraceae bacterium]
MSEELKNGVDERPDVSGNEAVISIEHLTKIYKLYDKPTDRLKESLGLSRKKRYTEHYALNDVSFDIKKGETVGIIGTNGSGKSTILKIITGVLGATSGEVKVNGRISALLELGAGFNMEYTGLENVYLNGTMNGFSKEEIDARLDDILAFADIGDFIHQPCKTYSSGMFVRLAFAVAINIDPEILIVDEALSVGDVFFQAKCYHKFEEFKKMGKTILFVSHDLGSISKYCDRVVLLNKGVKRAEGAPQAMVDLFKKLLVNLDDEEETEEAPAEEAEKKPTDAEAAESIRQKTEEKIKADDSLTGGLPMNPNTVSYGEKQAEIIQVLTMDANGNVTGSLEKNKPFTIKMKVRFNSDVNEPIFAYTIKTLKGTDVTGTNTMYEDTPLKPMKAGDVVEITFDQDMNLQGGEYLVSFGCTGYMEGDFRVFHRLYDILNITVISTKNTVGFYDMNSKVTAAVKEKD